MRFHIRVDRNVSDSWILNKEILTFNRYQHPKIPQNIPQYHWKTPKIALIQGPKITFGGDFALFLPSIGLGKAPPNAIGKLPKLP
jgi:hypothetical protein